MDNEIFKLPAELVSLYLLEPDLKDIYVEGTTDKSVISSFSSEMGLNYNVYTIESVDTSELITFSGEYIEAKQKVEALAEYFEAKLGTRKQCVFCVCDQDFDHILNNTSSSSYLLKTDYASLEGYIINEQVIDKYLQFMHPGFPFNASQIFQNISSVLSDIYFFRLARYSIDKFHKIIEIDDACGINSNGSINFDNIDYSNKLCHKNRVPALVERYKQTFSEIKTRFSVLDIRYLMRGHDFTKILYKYINKFKSFKIEFKSFERALFIALDIPSLINYPLFKTLAQC